MNKFESDPEMRWPSCARCKHKHLNAMTCEAFPGGIPLDILDAEDLHTTSRAGEVTFAPVDE
jgi:hypothetical protein